MSRERFNWAKIRAEWEAGATYAELSRKKGYPTVAAIRKRCIQGEWTQDLEARIQAKVSAKVSGAVSARTSKEIEKAVDNEAEKRAAVEKRHREEPGLVRGILYKGIGEQKKATTRAEKALALEDIKAAKMASDVLKNLHEIERKAFRLEEPAQSVSVKGSSALSKDQALALLAANNIDKK